VDAAVHLVAMVTDCEVAAAAVSTNNTSSLSACVRITSRRIAFFVVFTGANMTS